MMLLPSLLDEMRRYAIEHDVPIVRRESEALLTELVQNNQPRRLLEIGTAIGYSTLLLASAMPADASLVSLELDTVRADAAKANIETAQFARQVTVLVGDALEVIPRLDGCFDFVFIDGAKGQYLNCLKLLLPKLTPGATIVADNVLFRGMVMSPEEPPRRYRTLVRRLRDYLSFVSDSKSFITTVLPEGDGVAISVYQGDAHEEA